MSDSEGEFMCSQVSNMDYTASQSYDYGGDIVDEEVPIGEDVVYLEGNQQANFENCVNSLKESKNSRIVYNNVRIEDISEDEDMENM